MPVIGARVKSLRLDRDLNVGQLSYKTGVSTAHIYKIENNDRPNVSAVMLARLATGLDTSVDYLVGLTNDPRSRPRAEKTDEDPELILRRQQLAERVAKLPPNRQRVVMEAVLLLVEAENTVNAIDEEDVLPDPEESEHRRSGDR